MTVNVRLPRMCVLGTVVCFGHVCRPQGTRLELGDKSTEVAATLLFCCKFYLFCQLLFIHLPYTLIQRNKQLRQGTIQANS